MPPFVLSSPSSPETPSTLMFPVNVRSERVLLVGTADRCRWPCKPSPAAAPTPPHRRGACTKAKTRCIAPLRAICPVLRIVRLWLAPAELRGDIFQKTFDYVSVVIHSECVRD